MEIQFSGQPHIKFGSGNFSVNSEGHIHAAGGGDIAGWKVSDNGLYYLSNGVNIKNQGTANINNSIVGMSPYNTYDNNGYYTGVFWAGTPDKIDENKNNKENFIIQPINNKEFYQRNFFVTQGGYLFSKKGQIAGWNIEEDKLSKGYVGMTPKNWVLRTETIEVKGKTQEIPIYTGVFWAGEPDKTSSIQVPGTNSYFAKRKFFVTGGGFLFSKAGNIGGWNIKEDELSYTTDTVDRKLGLSPFNLNLIWAKNEEGTKIFSVSRNGYLYAKNGEIGNWYFGDNGLYGGDSANSYDGNQAGVYVGSDGIRLGSTFHVTKDGSIYAREGDIGGCTISNDGISGIGWYIKGGGDAGFSNVKINGTSVVDLVGFTSKGGAGGGTSIGKGSSIGNGARLDPTNTKTGDKETLDTYIENLIVDTLKADKIWSDIGVIGGLNVKNLYVSGKADLDCETFIDHFGLGGNPLSDTIADIWTAIRNLQNATPSS